jgi:hypothetical protein
MTTTANTDVFPLTPGTMVTINPTNFQNVVGIIPSPLLQITVTQSATNPAIFTISFPSVGYTADISFVGGMITVTPTQASNSLGILSTPSGMMVSFKFPSSGGNPGATYTFKFTFDPSTFLNASVQVFYSVSRAFISDSTVDGGKVITPSPILTPITTTSCGCIKPDVQSIINGTNTPLTRNQLSILGRCECKCINVPILTILGQTLVNGDDIGNVIFTIIDDRQYYCKEPLSSRDDNKNFGCGVFFAKESQLKTTRFSKCCPMIVSVVKGEGKTLYEKLGDIFNTLGQDVIGVDFQTFYNRIFFYAMLKYILARILYGKFRIKFLLGKFNEQFLEDLGKSRFCAALHLFLDCDSIVFGYDKYFKFDEECNHDRK